MSALPLIDTWTDGCCPRALSHAVHHNVPAKHEATPRDRMPLAGFAARRAWGYAYVQCVALTVQCLNFMYGTWCPPCSQFGSSRKGGVVSLGTNGTAPLRTFSLAHARCGRPHGGATPRYATTTTAADLMNVHTSSFLTSPSCIGPPFGALVPLCHMAAAAIAWHPRHAI